MRYQRPISTPAHPRPPRRITPQLVRSTRWATCLVALVSHAPSQQQFDELGKRYLPSHSDPSRALALGDVDGDGDPDLIIGNIGQNRLYLNDGTGRFSDATAALPTDNDDTRAVVLGDVNRDGHPDLIVVNSREENRLYLNNGDGTFVDGTVPWLPFGNYSSQGAAMGDLDADGDIDLVFAVGRRPNRLLLNDGLRRFVDVSGLRMPRHSERTRAVALSDVDRDGDLDMVLGNGELFAPEQNRIYINDGTGTFEDDTIGRLPALADITHAVAVGDVDGDGDMDLVVGNNGEQNRLLLNDGDGTFADATTGRMPVDSDSTRAVTLGDVDGDGDPDLIIGNEGGAPNRLYLNDGSGTFGDAPTHLPSGVSSTAAIALGDADMDGSIDVVVGDGSGENQLYLNRGTGEFVSVSSGLIPANMGRASDIATGDVDADGDTDLIFGTDGQNVLYLNDSNGNYIDTTAARMPTDNDITLAAKLGDVDGDGDLDLIAGSGLRLVPIPPSGGQNRLYLNDGFGTFVDATTARMPNDNEDTYALDLGDVDGDGDLDVVFGNMAGTFPIPIPGQNQLYLNDGDGVFSDATASLMPVDNDSTRAVVLGDVDADGDLDLFCGNYGQSNRLYLNDGFGRFVDATYSRLPGDSDNTEAAVLQDVDGDGDPDLVCGNDAQQNRLWLNDGSGTFVNATAARLPTDDDRTRALALADVDNDGDPDLVFANIGNRQDRLYLNDGSGTFADVTATRLPTENEDTRAVALADVDSDGDLEIIVAKDRNRLYANLLRQLDVPLVVRLGMPYQLDVYARYGVAGPGDVAAVMLSASTAHIPLPPIGTLGLDPSQLLWLPAVAVPQPTGVVSVSVPVPSVPSLAGLPIYAQAFLVQSPGGAFLTNWTADTILR